MAFPPTFLTELKNRLSIVEEIGSRIRLIKNGREYKALCPFHNEKTPSFTVSADKGFYHCFGCGANGDALNFVMEYDKQPFVDTVKALADKVGLPIPVESQPVAAAPPRAYQILEEACRWFEAQLHTKAGQAALAYVQGRGVSPATIASFRLGFAPDKWDGLLTYLSAKGYSEAERLESGLFIRNDTGRVYDRFRGRVMFPILDRRGQVIAFGGRVLDESEPKYLNSPETALFHKGQQLYNYKGAAKAGRGDGQLFVVEGYMDVIGLAEAGITGAVAPLGTALTEAQLGLCWQVVDEPILCFDGDAAGQRAMARAIERALPLLKPAKSLRFLTLPAGEDPDSFVRAHGAAAFTNLAKAATRLPEQLYTLTRLAQPTQTPEQKAAFKKALLDAAGRINDADIQALYKDTLRQRFQQDFQTPRFTRQRLAPPAPQVSHGLDTSVSVNKRRRYEGLIAAILNHPHILDDVAEEFGALLIPYPDLDKIRQQLITTYSQLNGQEGASLANHVAVHPAHRIVCTDSVYTLNDFAAPSYPPANVAERWRARVAEITQRQTKQRLDATNEETWNRSLNEKLTLCNNSSD